MPASLDIDICVCTFRRPHIAHTLRSISHLAVQPHWHIHIIVADNDDTPSARSTVEEIACETGLAVTYLHAPARNISIARNACLDAATAQLLAFIDDDELVTPQWLAALLSTMESSPYDAVLGPVHAEYGRACPRWIIDGDFLSTKPVWVGSHILTGYAGNVIIRRAAPSIQGLRFKKELGRSGGEDTVFFGAMVRMGGRMGYAPEAVVTEVVSPERATLAWLLQRRFRVGTTHALLLLENDGERYPIRARQLAEATAKVSFCFSIALLHVFKRDRMRWWLLRGILHAGVVSGLFTLSDRPYKLPPQAVGGSVGEAQDGS